MQPIKKGFIEKLKEKPEPVRRAIAFWASLGLAVIILAAWATQLPNKLSGTSSQVASPIEALKSEFNQVKGK